MHLNLPPCGSAFVNGCAHLLFESNVPSEFVEANKRANLARIKLDEICFGVEL